MRRGISQTKRIVTVSAVGLALLVLAGMLAPDSIRAHETPPAARTKQALQGESSADSSDSNEGLIPLGVLHQRGFAVSMFAADPGPLYTIHDDDGRELARLLTAKQVQQRFPELELQAIDFSAPVHDAVPEQVMHADPFGDGH